MGQQSRRRTSETWLRASLRSTPGAVVPRTVRARLLVDAEHYDELVIGALSRAKISVWIATANVKTMLVQAPLGTVARARGRFISGVELLAGLARRGVE